MVEQITHLHCIRYLQRQRMHLPTFPKSAPQFNGQYSLEPLLLLDRLASFRKATSSHTVRSIANIRFISLREAVTSSFNARISSVAAHIQMKNDRNQALNLWHVKRQCHAERASALPPGTAHMIRFTSTVTNTALKIQNYYILLVPITYIYT